MNESVKRTENFDKNSSNDGHYFYGLYGLFGLCWSIFGQHNMVGGTRTSGGGGGGGGGGALVQQALGIGMVHVQRTLASNVPVSSTCVN